MADIALTLTVGTIVAKSIARLWLKGEALGSATDNILDILGKRVSDTLAQRRGKRQFDTLAERVAEALLPVFEGSGLTPNGRQAVAYAVADTLNKADLSAAALAVRNLDPADLAKYLLASRPSATRGLNEPETAFYERIITDCAAYIIDTASQLPSFTESTLAEILKREDNIVAVVREVLEEIQRIREGSAQSGQDEATARFEELYRGAIARNLDSLELFGVDVSTVSRRRRLSVAYVSLSVSQKLSDELHLAVAIEMPAADPSGGPPSESDDDAQTVRRVEDVLAAGRRLLIRGPAGSGKTTLLRWIAVKAATRCFREPLASWNESIPFMVTLRQAITHGLPSPQNFPALIAPSLAGTMPLGYVHHQLQAGRAIVLIDGVDEVPQALRASVREWLDDLVGTFPDSRFIVTSRPTAIVEGWLDQSKFSEADLQDMSLEDVWAFIEHWHRALFEDLQYDEERAVVQDQMHHLLEVVRASRPLRVLATNPLLCAVLCAVHRDRNKQLPSDRIELYESCVQMLVDRRDKERAISVEGIDFPPFTYRQKRVFLEDIAYWMLNNSWTAVPVDAAERRLSTRLQNMDPSIRKLSPQLVRQLLVERTGLLREPVPGSLDFTHRTFQEFLAAKAALDNGDIGVLASHAHDDQWREVIILACGLAGLKNRQQLISLLIERGDKEPANRHQLHLLAVACLETSVELGADLEGEVRKRLKKLVPPNTLAEAASLASAGDLAVPFLKAGRMYSRPAAASVRALALIGTDAALDALSSYTKEQRQTVLRELVKAADYFDGERYARQVLANIHVTALKLSRMASLELLPYLGDLRRLKITGSVGLTDLGPLTKLKQLRALELDGCPDITTIEALRELTLLEYLSVWPLSRVSDLGPLSNLRLLRDLHLGGRELGDLRPMEALQKLERLSLAFCEALVDVDPIRVLPRLRSFQLYRCGNVTDLACVNSLPQLIDLRLGHCGGLRGIEAIGPSQSLRALRIRYHPTLAEINEITRFPNLTEVEFLWCPRLQDLQPLLQLASLAVVRIEPYDLANVPPELRTRVKRGRA